MKKCLPVTALVLALAAGALILLNVRLDRTKTPINQRAEHAWGDAAAADSLTLHTVLTYGDKLFWDTDYRVAAGEESTRFTFRPQGLRVQEGGVTLADDTWYITQLCRTERGSFVTEDLLDNDTDRTRNVHVKTAFACYALYLTPSGGEETTVISTTDRTQCVAFDKIRIPIGDEDQLEEYVFQRGRDDHGFQYTFLRQETRSRAFSLGGQGHVLVTLGFAADAPVRADWAPEGFGLWDVPVKREGSDYTGGWSNGRPDVSGTRLVYPLDIEKQRVTALERAADGSVLLVTAEDDRFVLRVLDGETCALRQELVLGQAEQTIWSNQYQEATDYGEVWIRQEEDFTLVTLNDKELLVLQEEAGNWRIVLRSPLMELRYRYDEQDGMQWEWKEAGAPDESGGTYTGYAYSLREYGILGGLAAVFRDGKLALALRTQYSDAVLLEIYEDGGMRYGAEMGNDLNGSWISDRYQMSYPWTGSAIQLTWGE